MTTNTTPPVGIWPLVPYADPRAGMRFLIDAFGFTEGITVTGDNEEIVHAELRWPNGGGVMIGTVDPENPFSQPRGSQMLYVYTPDTDALFERARSAGAEPVRQPQDQPYGAREAAMRDPEGNTFNFGNYPGS